MNPSRWAPRNIPQSAHLGVAPCDRGRYRPAPVHPSADSPPPVDAPRAEPPRSWLAVAALLEEHGFGELAAAGDDPFEGTNADDDSGR